MYIVFEYLLHATPEVVFQAKLGRVCHLIGQSLVDHVIELLPLPKEVPDLVTPAVQATAPFLSYLSC